ncbi:MAG: hypothetical protein K5896_02065 [Prevotella sp.]|nr:hypothetical protein [Prevotella sp.]
MAVALFLADLAYSTLLDNKIIQRERISLIIILLGFVVVGVILEANPEFQNMSIFWTGLIWISLTLLKVIHTPNVPKKDSQRQTWRVINEN